MVLIATTALRVPTTCPRHSGGMLSARKAVPIMAAIAPVIFCSSTIPKMTHSCVSCASRMGSGTSAR